MNITQEQQHTKPQKKSNASKQNNTGIPLQMKRQYEKLSGFSFDDVKVHYNSDKPAQFQALAYTQGNQVFIGPGQETHLSHELGHVVQQKQGIVHPTKMINKMPVNDDQRLEAQCDTMINMAPIMQRKTASQSNKNMTVQLFNFRGVDCKDLSSLAEQIARLETEESLKRAENFKAIDELICIDGESSYDISDITEPSQIIESIITYLETNPFKTLKKLYLYLCKNSYVPEKNQFSDKKPFTQNIVNLNYLLPKPILDTIDKLASSQVNEQFFFALKHHNDMMREDYPIENPGDNIDPNDITETFSPFTSCVITALLYAEGTVFGATQVRELHNILVTYFSDYQKSQEGDAPNIKNNVWKNYSDDHVYPSLYEYLGYSKKSISPNPKLDQLETITDLKNTKGIVTNDTHAIGYKLDASSALRLKDNDSGENKDSILSSHGSKKIIAIYYKRL